MKRMIVIVFVGVVVFGLTNSSVNAQSDEAIIIMQDMSQVFTYDPGRVFEFPAAPVVANAYERLVNYQGGDFSKVVPELAEKWEVSENGLVYTFFLRRGVKFSTGNELTAEDVVFSFKRLRNLKDNPSFLAEPIEDVEATSPYTVRIRLKEPQSDFLERITCPNFGVMDSKVVKSQGGTSSTDAATADKVGPWINTHSAGTGPWVLASYEQYQKTVLEPNANYWGGKVFAGRVILVHAKETSSRMLALQSGRADIALDLTTPQLNELRASKGFRILEGNTFTPFFVAMTCKPELSKPISNPKVQLAVRYALDVDGFVDKVLYGASYKPATIIPVGVLGSEPEFNEKVRIRRDLDKAKKLLESAGYPQGFSIEMQYPAGTVTNGVPYDAMAQKVAQDLGEVGINVRLVPGTRQSVLTAYRAGQLTMLLFQFYFEYVGPRYPAEAFSPGPRGVVSKRMGFQHEALEKLVHQVSVEMNKGKAADLYHEIIKTHINEGPIAVMAQPKLFIPIRENVITGAEVSPISYLNLRNIAKTK